MKRVDYYKFLLYIKVSDKTSYEERNRKIILNRAKKYYKKNQKRLRGEAKNKCRDSSEKEKDVMREYGGNRYKNMSKENKQRSKEYEKNYRRAKK